MRPLASVCCLAIFLPLAGCENGGKRFIFGSLTPQPTSGPASVDQLVAYLNDNAARVESLYCVDVDGTFQNYGFRAKMMAMKPRNFLMSASALSNPIVDIGSNDNEFWFWSSKAPEPYQYFCSYKDFEDGKVAQFPFPFQPEWILMALGMGPYGPASKYTLEQDARTYKLVERAQSPKGAVRKVIVMNRNEVFAPVPQVQAYLLLDDATGKEICSAHVQTTQVASSALIPRRLELRVPNDKSKLTLIFNDMKVNTKLEATQFLRQPMVGVQSYDLANGLVPVGGVSRSPRPSP
jgi:hypothetical protein